jgi:hypothetical protein
MPYITMIAFSLLGASFALVGLLAPATLAALAPTETVLTPVGYRPVGNVHVVPEGMSFNMSEETRNNVSLLGGRVVHVNHEVRLVDAAGKVLHVATNDGTKVRGTPVGDAVDPEATGWVAYASWYNTGSSPISSFTTTWTVPPAPATYDGQTVFLFNSIEPAGGNVILQPVLQYGPSHAGGGAYWAVASWYVVGEQAYHTSLFQVSVGDYLDAVISLTSTDGNSYNYISLFSNVAGTTFTAVGAAQLVWATETLESYGVTSSSDYPAGSTVFSSIYLDTSDGTPSVTWSPVSDTDDGLITTVNIDGATNAQITITYPNSD